MPRYSGSSWKSQVLLLHTTYGFPMEEVKGLSSYVVPQTNRRLKGMGVTLLIVSLLTLGEWQLPVMEATQTPLSEDTRYMLFCRHH